MAGSNYPVTVYVPSPLALGAKSIDPRSAIVGSPSAEWFHGTAGEGGHDDGRVVVDFEGRRFNQANIITFADKCLHAAGRHLQHFPTTARAWLPEEELTEVGEFDGAHVFVTDPHTLAAWLGYETNIGAMGLELSTSRTAFVR